MLNGVLSLGDIRDVEKLCDRIVQQAVGSQVEKRGKLQQASGVSINGLSFGERDDLLAYLIAETWVLWLRFDASDDGRGRKTFSGYAVPQLRCRVLDWWRKKLGRGSSPGEWGVVSTEALDESELDRVFGSGDGDDPFARVSDLEWAVAAGGGKPRRHEHARRRGASRRVT